MDVVIITPEPGLHKEIGQRLLAMADDPRDVQWVTWPTAGYAVPLELFGRFDAEGQAAEAEESTPAPRRRGRPRKQEPESTDNTTSEEE